MNQAILLLLCLGGAFFASCSDRGKKTKRKSPAVVVVDPEEQNAAIEEKEKNDSRANAMSVSVDNIIKARLSGAEDKDWYRLESSKEDQVLRVNVNSVDYLDLHLSVYDAQGKYLVSIDNGGPGESEVLSNLALDPGVYYLRISHAKRKEKRRVRKKKKKERKVAASEGGYRIVMRSRNLDTGEEKEPNWKQTIASTLTLGDEASGYLGWKRDTDWYVVSLGQNEGAASKPASEQHIVDALQRMRVELDGIDGVWLSLAIYDEKLKPIQQRRGRPGEQVVLSNLIKPGGELFYIAVRANRTFNAESKYNLRVLLTRPNGTEIEPNDDFQHATMLPLNIAASGLLGDAYDIDTYALDIADNAFIRVVVSPPLALDPSISLLDSKGERIYEIDDEQAGKPEVIPAFFVKSGRVYLQIRSKHHSAVDSASVYKIFAQTMRDVDLEREPNAKLNTATPLPHACKNFKGYAHPKKDIDYFGLQRSTSRQYSVVPPDGTKLKMSIVDEMGKEIVTSKGIDMQGRLSLRVNMMNKTLYLKIETLDGSNSRSPYTITCEEGDVAPIAPMTPLN